MLFWRCVGREYVGLGGKLVDGMISAVVDGIIMSRATGIYTSTPSSGTKRQVSIVDSTRSIRH